MKYLLYGGSFDPFHDGHLAVITEAQKFFRDRGDEPKIMVIPMQSPFKGKRQTPLVETEETINALLLDKGVTRVMAGAVGGDAAITADFMIDTLENIIIAIDMDLVKEDLGIIVGSDVVKRFTEWARWEDILRIASLVVIPRPGYPITMGEIWDAIEHPDLEVHLLDEGLTPDVSSTEIKKQGK